jgi:hypothetical protein
MADKKKVSLRMLRKCYVQKYTKMTYEDDLVKLKEKYKKNVEVCDLIDELAIERNYFKVVQQINLRNIDLIVRKKHENFALIDIVLTGTREASMSMEFHYDIIFNDDRRYARDHEMYGIHFECDGEIDGEMWDDWIANDGDESWDIVKVSKKEEVQVVYKFGDE